MSDLTREQLLAELRKMLMHQVEIAARCVPDDPVWPEYVKSVRVSVARTAYWIYKPHGLEKQVKVEAFEPSRALEVLEGVKDGRRAAIVEVTDPEGRKIAFRFVQKEKPTEAEKRERAEVVDKVWGHLAPKNPAWAKIKQTKPDGFKDGK